MHKQQKHSFGFLFLLLVFCFGVVMGGVWYRQGLFPFRQLQGMRYFLRVKSPLMLRYGLTRKRTDWMCSIHARYFPKRQKKKEEKDIINEEGVVFLNLSADEVALVLVDTWGMPQEGVESSLIVRNQKAILEKCREHGVKIIHAPSQPFVDKYPQYHALKKEVDNFMKQFPVQAGKPSPPFLSWPSLFNEPWQKVQALRSEGRKSAESYLMAKMDISKPLKPLDNEYVLCSYLEFRYVLWKEGIKLLLYVGGALNECMLHRDTGINLLAGSDSQRVPITIVVLDDCSLAKPSHNLSAEAAAKAILDYYELKIALVASSNDIRFYKRSAAKEIEQSAQPDQ